MSVLSQDQPSPSFVDHNDNDNRLPYPVLFLDIDGVLNNWTHLKKVKFNIPHKPEDEISDELILVLNRVFVEVPETMVVLSSNWRLKHVFGYNNTVHALKTKRFIGNFIGQTPHHDNYDRGEEIHSWIETHGNPQTWVVLDDNPVGVDPSWRWVETDPSYGITESLVDEVVHILKHNKPLTNPTGQFNSLMPARPPRT